jgi:hypothetical protein
MRGLVSVVWIAALFGEPMAMTSAHAAEPFGDLAFSVGAERTRGDYGTSTQTDIWYFPLAASYETGRTVFAVTVPYLIVQGAGDVVVVGGQGVRARSRTTTTRTTESGLGDVIASGSYGLLTGEGGRPSLDITAKVKFGTADEDRGLGTGENDYALQLDFSSANGALIFLGNFGYKILGDTATVDFDNVVYGSAGAEWQFGDNTLGLTADLQQASLADTEGRCELTVSFAYEFSGGRSLGVYAIKGFSDSSPDWGAGIKLQFAAR